jgi:hypothetical protein
MGGWAALIGGLAQGFAAPAIQKEQKQMAEAFALKQAKIRAITQALSDPAIASDKDSAQYFGSMLQDLLSPTPATKGKGSKEQKSGFLGAVLGTLGGMGKALLGQGGQQQDTQTSSVPTRNFGEAYRLASIAEQKVPQREFEEKRRESLIEIRDAAQEAEDQKNMRARWAKESGLPMDTDTQEYILSGKFGTRTAQMEERKAEFSQTLQLRRDQLDQQNRLTQERLADQRLAEKDRVSLQEQMIAERWEIAKLGVEARMAATSGKSRIPADQQRRINQAYVIQDQIADLRSKLSNPALTRYMGPVVGRTGFITRQFSPTVQNFYASQISLDSLLPVLHGFRAGANMVKTFEESMGTLSMTPASYRGTLDALDSLSRNFIEEAKRKYPNDAFWGEEPQPVTRTGSGVPKRGQGSSDSGEHLYFDSQGNEIQR